MTSQGFPTVSDDAATEGSAADATARETEFRENHAFGAQCCRCGSKSRVRVLTGYADCDPQFEDLCLNCANHNRQSHPDIIRTPDRARQHGVFLLLMFGLALGIVGVLADYLGISGQKGFGLLQIAGVLIGAVCVLTGSMLRVDSLSLAGVVVFALSLCADLVGIGGSPGMGIKQLAVILVALLLITIGITLHFRARRPGLTAVGLQGDMTVDSGK